MSINGFEFLSGKRFYIRGNSDLDLWSTGPKINRDHIWTYTVPRKINFCEISLKLMNEHDFAIAIRSGV